MTFVPGKFEFLCMENNRIMFSVRGVGLYPIMTYRILALTYNKPNQLPLAYSFGVQNYNGSPSVICINENAP